jgi:hypothetical protein
MTYGEYPMTDEGTGRGLSASFKRNPIEVIGLLLLFGCVIISLGLSTALFVKINNKCLLLFIFTRKTNILYFQHNNQLLSMNQLFVADQRCLIIVDC